MLLSSPASSTDTKHINLVSDSFNGSVKGYHNRKLALTAIIDQHFSGACVRLPAGTYSINYKDKRGSIVSESREIKGGDLVKRRLATGEVVYQVVTPDTEVGGTAVRSIYYFKRGGGPDGLERIECTVDCQIYDMHSRSSSRQAHREAAYATKYAQGEPIIQDGQQGYLFTTPRVALKSLSELAKPSTGAFRSRESPIEKLSFSAALRLALLVSEAVVDMHHEGDLHGAINPDNVLVDLDSMTVALRGFGFSKRDTVFSMSSQIPYQAYQAPEVAMGEVTRQSDIYSLAGVLALVMGQEDPAAGKRSSGLGQFAMFQVDQIKKVERPEDIQRRKSVIQTLQGMQAISSERPSIDGVAAGLDALLEQKSPYDLTRLLAGIDRALRIVHRAMQARPDDRKKEVLSEINDQLIRRRSELQLQMLKTFSEEAYIIEYNKVLDCLDCLSAVSEMSLSPKSVLNGATRKISRLCAAIGQQVNPGAKRRHYNWQNFGFFRPKTMHDISRAVRAFASVAGQLENLPVPDGLELEAGSHRRLNR